MPLPMTYDRPSQEVVAAAMASELVGKITRPSPRRTKTVWHSSQATAARRSPNNNGTHYASFADSSDPNTTEPLPVRARTPEMLRGRSDHPQAARSRRALGPDGSLTPSSPASCAATLTPETSVGRRDVVQSKL